MTDTTTAAAKPNAAKHPASPFGLPKGPHIPKFDLPTMEVPAAFSELADKSVA